jgi:dimethylargininase
MRRPAPTFADGLTTNSHLGTPDPDLTKSQYESYLTALRACGLDVTLLPPDEQFPDGHFVEDPVVIFRDMAFIARPGAKPRENEGAILVEHLIHLNRVYTESTEAHLEGGDVLFCTDRVLIGLGERTNRAGAEQLSSALRGVQSDLKVDFVPFGNVIHLKTGLTEIAPGVLVHNPRMTMDFDPGFSEVINLPPEQGYAANTLPINDTLLLIEGYPDVVEIAEKHYANIITLNMSEFEKMDGSLTCLSPRY